MIDLEGAGTKAGTRWMREVPAPRPAQDGCVRCPQELPHVIL